MLMDKQEVALLQQHGHQLYISYLKEIWMTLAQKIHHFPLANFPGALFREKIEHYWEKSDQIPV
jgi:hypothetical protein